MRLVHLKLMDVTILLLLLGLLAPITAILQITLSGLDTDNTTNEPGLVYANNRPLYYLPSEQGGEKLIGPPTPEITGVPSLNQLTTPPLDIQSVQIKIIMVLPGGL